MKAEPPSVKPNKRHLSDYAIDTVAVVSGVTIMFLALVIGCYGGCYTLEINKTKRLELEVRKLELEQEFDKRSSNP